jgi:hypothetical protein
MPRLVFLSDTRAGAGAADAEAIGTAATPTTAIVAARRCMGLRIIDGLLGD